MWKPRILIVTTVFLSVFFLAVCANFVSATKTFPPTLHFGIPLYNTSVNFQAESTFTDVYRESNFWVFINGSSTVSLQPQSCNLTVTKFLVANHFQALVYGSIGAISTTLVRTSFNTPPSHVIVNGTELNTRSYDSGTNTLTVYIDHASSCHLLDVDYTTTTGGGDFQSQAFFTVQPANIHVQRGSSASVSIPVSWSQSSTLSVLSLSLTDHAGWFTVPSLPATFTMTQGVGEGSIVVTVTVPENASLGLVSVPFSASAVANGRTLTASSYVAVTVESPSSGFQLSIASAIAFLASNLLWVAGGLLVLVVGYGLKRKRGT